MTKKENIIANKFIKFYIQENGLLNCEILKSDTYVIGYEQLRKAVGGTLASCYYADFGNPNINAYVDDDGFAKGFIPTFWLADKTKCEKVGDKYKVSSVYKYPLVGNVVVVKHENINGDGLESICLTDEEIELVKSKVMYSRLGDNYILFMDDEYMKSSQEFYNSLKEEGFEIINIF